MFTYPNAVHTYTLFHFNFLHNVPFALSSSHLTLSMYCWAGSMYIHMYLFPITWLYCYNCFPLQSVCGLLCTRVYTRTCQTIYARAHTDNDALSCTDTHIRAQQGNLSYTHNVSVLSSAHFRHAIAVVMPVTYTLSIWAGANDTAESTFLRPTKQLWPATQREWKWLYFDTLVCRPLSTVLTFAASRQWSIWSLSSSQFTVAQCCLV